MVRTFTLFLLFIFSVPVLAAAITVKTDRDPVGLDETFQIAFTVDGKQDGEPDFNPLNKDFQLLGTSQSSSFSMINGSVSSSKTYTLTVVANRAGKLTIPAIQFGKDKSAPRSITVTQSGQAQGAPSPGIATTATDQMFIKAEVDSTKPYIQQQVILKLKIYRRVQWADAKLSDPAFDGAEAIIQPLGKEKSYETDYQGKRYAVTELRYALFPQQSGKLTIQPFRLTAKIPTGKKQQSSPFGKRFNDPFFDDFFSRTRQTYTTKSTQSNAITLNIQAIPNSFQGKQWLPAKDLQLQETWPDNITSLQAGEPVTRTIAVIADGLSVGQLPEIVLTDLPGLKHYPDQPVTREQATDKGLLSTQTLKVALIPSQGGSFDIPAIEIPWWNTQTNKMEIARLPAKKISVSGDTVTSAAMPPVSATTQPESTPGQPAQQAAGVPTDEDTPVPYQWLLIACAALLLLWLVTFVAWMRNRKMPAKPETSALEDTKAASRKQALKHLQKACKQDDAKAARDALLEWARAMWPQATPTSLDEIARRTSPPLSESIQSLARVLYSPEKNSWDANAIYEGAKTFQPSNVNDSGTSAGGLEPMYR